MQTFAGRQNIACTNQTKLEQFKLGKSLGLRGTYQIHPSSQQCTDKVLHSCEMALEFAAVLEVLQTVDLMSANCNSLLRDVMRQ